MDIIINEPLNKFATKMYQGSRWRYPSMTDVKFLNDHHLIAAHRYGCKLYLIKLQYDTFTVIDTLIMTYNGNPYKTESFVIMDNTIYMISFSNVMTVIDILPDYTLKQRNSIILDRNNVPFHGITIRNTDIYITPSRKMTGDEYIICYNTLNNQITNTASLGNNIRVKDMTFLENGLIVILVNYKTLTSMTEDGHLFNGSIRLYTTEYELLDTVEVPLTHFDAVICKNNKFYATGADLESGYIFKGTVEDNKIKSILKHQVNDFPHGIDMKDNKIVYTSYSTSGIHIIDESTLINPVVVYNK